MIDLIYRWVYRREIRERRERGAAIAEAWRERQVENARRQTEQSEQLKDFRERAKAMSPDELLEAIRREFP